MTTPTNPTTAATPQTPLSASSAGSTTTPSDATHPQAGSTTPPSGANPARKLLLLGSLYFAQGLPFGFFSQALPAFLRKRNVSLEEIGLAYLLVAPWALKFLLAPFFDQLQSGKLGRRRRVILPLQLTAVVALLVLAALDFDRHLPAILGLVLLCNFLAASQDIATDGLAVETLSERERGLGNGLQVAGYRVGMIIGGGAMLVAFARLQWSGTFLAMAGLLLLATLPTVLHREEPKRLPSGKGFGPLATFLRQEGAVLWLLLLATFKTGDALGGGMLRPMLVDRGFEVEELGLLLGGGGFVAGLVGAMAGGLGVNRLGRKRSLLIFGLLQSLSVGAYGLIALGASRPVIWGLVGLEHFTGGLATAALFTWMMDACREESPASDYTLQACVVVAVTLIAGALSGLVAGRLGYGPLYLVALVLSAAGALYAGLFGKLPGNQPTPKVAR